MAHRNTFVLQSTLANTSQMIEGFIDGLMVKRPAIFNIYTTCQPEHGVADDLGVNQARLAMESRAYPIFQYNPNKGQKIEQCLDLSGNPFINQIWPAYKLKYNEYGQEKTMEVAMTFADFAITEARFRKHFRKVPRDAWNDNMVILSEFLEMSEEKREGLFPYIWTVDKKQNLVRVLVAAQIVESCEDRRNFWLMLCELAGLNKEKSEVVDIEKKIRTEVINRISKGLMQLAGDDGQRGPIDRLAQ